MQSKRHDEKWISSFLLLLLLPAASLIVIREKQIRFHLLTILGIVLRSRDFILLDFQNVTLLFSL
jgi:hypothetical protein